MKVFEGIYKRKERMEIMAFIGKLIILEIVLLFVILGYACCLVAATSDEEAKRIYRGEHLARKNKKENEKKWKE